MSEASGISTNLQESTTNVPPKIGKGKVLTEDLGKTVEFVICKVIGTEFKGNFKYCLTRVAKLQERFSFLKEILNGYKYTGNESNLNDFEKEEIVEKTETSEKVKLYHLSVKTTKKKNDWKICPQLIGQPTRFTFCQKFGLQNESSKSNEVSKTSKSKESKTLSDSALKDYIVSHISEMMKEYEKTTFHCPIFFYNEGSDLAMIIKRTSSIDWTKFEFKFSHMEKDKSWNESTTLYVKNSSNSKLVTIGEFQFHTGRDCIKFRFHLKNVLDICKDNFEIVNF